MLRASGGRERVADDTTLSPTRISPAVGSTKPAIRGKVVVLPQQDGPSRQTNRPWSIRNDTSSTTANASYRLVKFRSSTDAPSTARENSLALFHERAAAFGIVVALEAFLDHGGAFGEVALRLVFDDLTDREFGRGDRHGGVCPDHIGVFFHIGFEFGCLHATVKEPHRARLFGVELARRVEDLLGK